MLSMTPFFRICAWLLVHVPLIAPNTINYAAIIDGNQSEIRAALSEAVNYINRNNNSMLNGHVLNVTLFFADEADRFIVLKQMCDLSPTINYDGLLDLSSSAGRCSSLSIAQHMDTPFMSNFGDRCFGVDVPSVRFSNDYYFRAMAKVAFQLNATREAMAIFFDDSFDVSTTFPMEDLNWYVPTYMFKIPKNLTEINALVAKVKRETPASEFIVAATASNAEAIISAAANNSFISTLFHWFVITRDLNNFQCRDCGSNTVIYLHHQTQQQNVLDIIKNKIGSDVWQTLGHKQLNAIFAYEAVISLTKVIKSMINFTDLWNNTTTLQCYAPKALNPTRYNQYISRLQLLSPYGGILDQINFNNSVYNNEVTFRVETCTQGSCKSSNVTYNSGNNSITGGMISYTYPRKMFLRVLVIHEPPFVYKSSDGNYSGYSVSTLQYMSQTLNFDFVISEPPDGKYGIKLADGSWNGMIGEIANGRADVALGPITITSEREAVVDFTIPYYDYAGLQIVLKKDSSSSQTDMFYFLTVFTNWVWLCIGATLVVTGILVTVFDKLSPYSYQNRTDELKEGEPEGKIFTFKESMWFVLGAYTQLGESFDPRATSTRMLVAGFWIFSCIMMAMYTANLAAFLTVSKLTSSISSVRQLASQTDVKYSVQADTAGYVFFERMKNIESNFFNIWKDISIGNEKTVDDVAKFSVWEYPIEERYTDMFDRMEKWGFFNSTETALDRIKSDNWAVFMETPMIKYHMSKDCDIVNTGEILSSRPYGIVLQNNSPLTRQFNTLILEMQRDRVLENYKVTWWENEKKVCPQVESNAGIKLQTLGGVFIFLAGGICLGGVVLVIEIIVVKIFGAERFKPVSSGVNHLTAHTPSTAAVQNVFRSRVSMYSTTTKSRTPRGSIKPSDGSADVEDGNVGGHCNNGFGHHDGEL